MEKFLGRLDWSDMDLDYFKKWTLIGIVLGLISAIGVILVQHLVQFIASVLLSNFVGFSAPIPDELSNSSAIYAVFVERPWLFPPIMFCIGLVVGLVGTKLAPESTGNGIDELNEFFHSKSRTIRARAGFTKSIISSLSLGSGASGGLESTMGYIVTSFSKVIHRLFKLNDEELRYIVASSMGAGIGSVLRVPFGGAIFSLEFLYRKNFVVRSLYPALLASLISYLFSGLVLGWYPVLQIPREIIQHISINSIAPMLLLAAVCGIASTFFVKLHLTLQESFAKLRIPRYLKPALGGLIVGIFAIGFPETIGTGYGWIQLVLNSNYQLLPVWMMIALIIVKIFSTSITTSSGSGLGLVGPSLVIGGIIGATIISTCHLFGIFGYVDISTGTLIGMFAFFAGSMKTPISSIIIATEIIGGYTLLVPVIVTVIISCLVSGKNTMLFRKYVSNNINLQNRSRFDKSFLANFRVRDAMNPNFYHVDEQTTLKDATKIMNESGTKILAAINNFEQLTGAVYFDQFSDVPDYQQNYTKVEKIMIKNPPTLLPTDTVEDALKLILNTGLPEILVVSPSDTKLVLATISIGDVSLLHDSKNQHALIDIDDIEKEPLDSEEVHIDIDFIKEKRTEVRNMWDLLKKLVHQ
jgi:CIC family chloride channel protein